ncbi:MAG: rod shape-determining protein MreD [Rikenellaceae bacterium]
MYKILKYIYLFIVVTLLQVLFMNNLTLSVMLSPLVYTAFIVLLPLETSRLVLLLAGLGCGVVMDSMGAQAGINTIATMFIAFVRPYILNIVVNKEVLAGSGTPSEARLGVTPFTYYLVYMVVIHAFIYFAFESLSLKNINLYLPRFIISALFSWLFVWLICRAFSSIINRKVS